MRAAAAKHHRTQDVPLRPARGDSGAPLLRLGVARSMLAILAVLQACGKDATAPQPQAIGPLDVILTVEPPAIVPGEQSQVTVTAKLPATQTLSAFELAVSGLGGDTIFQLPIVAAGTLAYSLEISIPNGPIEGSLTFRAHARVETVHDSAVATLTIHDDGPPKVLVTAPSVVEPPDSLLVAFDAQDAAGIPTLAIHVSGLVQRDTTLQTSYAPAVAWAFAEFVPATAHLGDSLLIEATAQDGFGKVSKTQRVVRLADTTPPGIHVTVDTIHHAGIDEWFFPLVFYPGDVVRIRLQGTDNHALSWLGYHMLQGGDSVPVTGAADSAALEFVIPAGSNTPDAFIEGFTVDSVGHRSIERVWASTMDGTFRPIEALNPYDDPLIEFDQQGGYVLDGKRDVLYFTTLSNQVNVIGLSPLRTLPVVPFGASVRSVDLTPDGDSLVALVLGRPNVLAVWDIATGPASTRSIPVTLLGDCDGWDMQVASNGHALVTGWSSSGCPTVDVNIRTGAQRLRAIPWELRNLVASSDHSVIVAWSPVRALVYHSATDSMTPVRDLYPPPATYDLAHEGPALDSSGASILIRNRLYTADLTSSTWIQPDPGFFPPAPALSADGKTAFVGSWPGYSRVDVATATAQDRIILPRFAWRMLAHPDGQRLIVFGWQWIGVVDLR